MKFRLMNILAKVSLSMKNLETEKFRKFSLRKSKMSDNFYINFGFHV